MFANSTMNNDFGLQHACHQSVKITTWKQHHFVNEDANLSRLTMPNISIYSRHQIIMMVTAHGYIVGRRHLQLCRNQFWVNWYLAGNQSARYTAALWMLHVNARVAYIDLNSHHRRPHDPQTVDMDSATIGATWIPDDGAAVCTLITQHSPIVTSRFPLLNADAPYGTVCRQLLYAVANIVDFHSRGDWKSNSCCAAEA